MANESNDSDKSENNLNESKKSTVEKEDDEDREVKTNSRKCINRRKQQNNRKQFRHEDITLYKLGPASKEAKKPSVSTISARPLGNLENQPQELPNENNQEEVPAVEQKSNLRTIRTPNSRKKVLNTVYTSSICIDDGENDVLPKLMLTPRKDEDLIAKNYQRMPNRTEDITLKTEEDELGNTVENEREGSQSCESGRHHLPLQVLERRKSIAEPLKPPPTSSTSTSSTLQNSADKVKSLQVLDGLHQQKSDKSQEQQTQNIDVINEIDLSQMKNLNPNPSLHPQNFPLENPSLRSEFAHSNMLRILSLLHHPSHKRLEVYFAPQGIETSNINTQTSAHPVNPTLTHQTETYFKNGTPTQNLNFPNTSAYPNYNTPIQQPPAMPNTVHHRLQFNPHERYTEERTNNNAKTRRRKQKNVDDMESFPPKHARINNMLNNLPYPGYENFAEHSTAPRIIPQNRPNFSQYFSSPQQYFDNTVKPLELYQHQLIPHPYFQMDKEMPDPMLIDTQHIPQPLNTHQNEPLALMQPNYQNSQNHNQFPKTSDVTITKISKERTNCNRENKQQEPSVLISKTGCYQDPMTLPTSAIAPQCKYPSNEFGSPRQASPSYNRSSLPVQSVYQPAFPEWNKSRASNEVSPNLQLLSDINKSQLLNAKHFASPQQGQRERIIPTPLHLQQMISNMNKSNIFMNDFPQPPSSSSRIQDLSRKPNGTDLPQGVRIKTTPRRSTLSPKTNFQNRSVLSSPQASPNTNSSASSALTPHSPIATPFNFNSVMNEPPVTVNNLSGSTTTDFYLRDIPSSCINPLTNLPKLAPIDEAYVEILNRFKRSLVRSCDASPTHKRPLLDSNVNANPNLDNAKMTSSNATQQICDKATSSSLNDSLLNPNVVKESSDHSNDNLELSYKNPTVPSSAVNPARLEKTSYSTDSSKNLNKSEVQNVASKQNGKDEIIKQPQVTSVENRISNCLNEIKSGPLKHQLCKSDSKLPITQKRNLNNNLKQSQSSKLHEECDSNTVIDCVNDNVKASSSKDHDVTLVAKSDCKPSFTGSSDALLEKVALNLVASDSTSHETEQISSIHLELISDKIGESSIQKNSNSSNLKMKLNSDSTSHETEQILSNHLELSSDKISESSIQENSNSSNLKMKLNSDNSKISPIKLTQSSSTPNLFEMSQKLPSPSNSISMDHKVSLPPEQSISSLKVSLPMGTKEPEKNNLIANIENSSSSSIKNLIKEAEDVNLASKENDEDATETSSLTKLETDDLEVAPEAALVENATQPSPARISTPTSSTLSIIDLDGESEVEEQNCTKTEEHSSSISSPMNENEDSNSLFTQQTFFALLRDIYGDEVLYKEEHTIILSFYLRHITITKNKPSKDANNKKFYLFLLPECISITPKNRSIYPRIQVHFEAGYTNLDTMVKSLTKSFAGVIHKLKVFINTKHGPWSFMRTENSSFLPSFEINYDLLQNLLQVREINTASSLNSRNRVFAYQISSINLPNVPKSNTKCKLSYREVGKLKPAGEYSPVVVVSESEDEDAVDSSIKHKHLVNTLETFIAATYIFCYTRCANCLGQIKTEEISECDMFEEDKKESTTKSALNVDDEKDAHVGKDDDSSKVNSDLNEMVKPGNLLTDEELTHSTDTLLEMTSPPSSTIYSSNKIDLDSEKINSNASPINLSSTHASQIQANKSSKIISLAYNQKTQNVSDENLIPLLNPQILTNIPECKKSSIVLNSATDANFVLSGETVSKPSTLQSDTNNLEKSAKTAQQSLVQSPIPSSQNSDQAAVGSPVVINQPVAQKIIFTTNKTPPPPLPPPPSSTKNSVIIHQSISLLPEKKLHHNQPPVSCNSQKSFIKIASVTEKRRKQLVTYQNENNYNQPKVQSKAKAYQPIPNSVWTLPNQNSQPENRSSMSSKYQVNQNCQFPSKHYQQSLHLQSQTLQIPQQLSYYNMDFLVSQLHSSEVLSPSQYDREISILQQNHCPSDYYDFYRFVTGKQIVANQNPISFRIFLEFKNANKLSFYVAEYHTYVANHKADAMKKSNKNNNNIKNNLINKWL